MYRSIFQSVHWIIFWPGKWSNPAKTLSCTKLQWWYMFNQGSLVQYKQESWKGENKLKASVVCNLSGWKGISEKHIVDCPMWTQLCNHTKGVSLSHSSEKGKVARLLHVNNLENYFCSRILPSIRKMSLSYKRTPTWEIFIVFILFLLFIYF